MPRQCYPPPPLPSHCWVDINVLLLLSMSERHKIYYTDQLDFPWFLSFDQRKGYFDFNPKIASGPGWD